MAELHQIHITTSDTSLTPLPMGGKNPDGAEISVNNRFLTLNGHPWLPVMGEFHFSRFPCDGWRDELLKMKSGGIDVVATYIFWNYIEEIEDQFDWSGQRDLRAFIALCGEIGLYAYPRIGPWAHGECRHGGFPDWLLEKCGSQVRMDAPLYLTYVRRLYQQISDQLQGLLWKNGGPVIGVQIENELLDNAAHIRTLKHLAVEVGIDVPLYTMTGWGPAQIPEGDEVIPVFGGYPDAFWDRQVVDWSRPARKQYLFSPLRDDNTIGADLLKRQGIQDLHNQDHYPYGTCETGGGMQVSYHRRPSITPKDIAAIAHVKVGSGSNLLGYYMYHGGANPIGKRSTLNESQETGYPNDLPVVNYDFQAPLGQYGQVRDTYFALRTLHLFLHEFGSLLARYPLTMPEVQPQSLNDRDALRWAVRSDGEHGFLFMNNYQRIEHLADHEAVQFQLNLPGGSILCPSKPVNIAAGQIFIWPVNLELAGVRLQYATAQLICQLPESDGDVLVFYAVDGIECEFAVDRSTLTRVDGPCVQTLIGDTVLLNGLNPGLDCLIELTAANGRLLRILVLTQAQSRQVQKAVWRGRERLLISAETLLIEPDSIRLQYRQPINPVEGMPISFALFPGLAGLVDEPGRLIPSEPDGVFTRYFLKGPSPSMNIQADLIQPAETAQAVQIGPFGVAQAPSDAAYERAAERKITFGALGGSNVREVLVSIHYVGDAARAYLNGRLVDDDFYHGKPWEIGIFRWLLELQNAPLLLRILPLVKDAPIYLPAEAKPDFSSDDQVCLVESITLEAICEVRAS